MKTFNTKLIVALITTLVLTGCMPDSLTKFKKEEPTKAPVVAPPTIVDSNGNGVDPSSLVFPSKFYFISEGSTPTIERNVDAVVDVEAITDGTLTDPTKRSILFINCKLVLDTASGTMTTTLPAGLTFNNQTCRITGTPSAVHFNNDGSAIQYTAEMSYKGPDYLETGIPLVLKAKIKIGIYEAPADLSYTSRQLIEVNSNASFVEGETLFQPIAVPATSSVTAKILRKVDSDKLSIETTNGNFLQQASLDSGNIFSLVKTSVKLNSAPNYYNLVLTLNSTANMASFLINGYVYNSVGAKGVIVYKDDTKKILYIRFLTRTVTSSDSSLVTGIKTFAQNDTIDNVFPNSSTPQGTIDQVEASNMVLTLSDASAFTAGHDISSSAYHSGYVYEQSSTDKTIKVDEINRTGNFGVQAIDSVYFRIGQTLSNSEYYAGPVTPISSVTHDNLLIVERGVPRIFYANSKGSLLSYSISPTLPAGLSIDPKTGNISGSASFMSPRTTYVVTATNMLGSTYFAFDLEVRDYFTFSENSGAKSFITHKVGDYKTYRPCRINANDILNPKTSDPLTVARLDIRCNVEAEEMDLYYTALKLKATVGPGVCEYVTFTPFAFWQYAPLQTKRTVNVKNDCVQGIAPDPVDLNLIDELPEIEDYCLGNYKDSTDPSNKGPNCDEGEITAVVWTGTAPGAACTIPTPQTIKCGGKKVACLAGPVTSVITSTTDLENGIRGQFVDSYQGLSKEWPIDSPYKSLDSSNLRNANGLVGNACSDSRDDASKWASLQYSISSTKTPFGGESPFYEFTCLDSARDPKARIRVSIRDWDRSFKINSRITELVPGLGASATIAATPAAPPVSAAPEVPEVTTIAAIADRLMNSSLAWNNNFDWDDKYNHPTNDNVKSHACGSLPGTCSNGAHTNFATCKDANETWTFKDPGTCTRATHLTRAACEAANETWIPTIEGSCSDGVQVTRAACIAVPAVWTLKDYPFPGDNI